MPPVMHGRRKRRAEPTPSSPSRSPEPAPQRRRVTPPSEPEDDDGRGNETNVPTPHSEQAVKKLVRLALACEYQRKPLRRTDITDKVLGKDTTRTFKPIFARAQQTLREVFGMELTALPAKEQTTVAEKRAAQKSQSQGPRAPQSWILTSTLPPQFRDPEILAPIAAPTQDVDATYTSIYTTLIALILLGGGQIPQAKLERHLRRLGLEDRTPVPGSEKTEKLLKRLEREGYVREIREKAMQGEEDVTFIVGPRGRVEVGARGVEGLVKAVYGDLGDQEERDLERKIQRSLGIGEGPSRAVLNGEGKKKRGRPRRDAGEGGGSGSEEEEDE